MGRKKIVIQPIPSKRARANTYKKRGPGLMKKAYELGVLCECDYDVFLYVRNKNTGITNMYASTDEDFIPDYGNLRPGDRKGPGDFEALYRSRGGARKKIKTAEDKQSLWLANHAKIMTVEGDAGSKWAWIRELSREMRSLMASVAEDEKLCLAALNQTGIRKT